MINKSIACVLVLLTVFSTRAATFTVTPNLVSNNYTGLITFQIGGLSTGDTVRVEEFFDANNNGLVDAGEFGVRFELVTDGQAKPIAGVANPYAFQDLDGAANGAITASIPFALAPDTTRGIGHYIFRISSPLGYFPATNLLFAVTSPPYAQTIQGSVVNNSTNVPFALVSLTQQTSSGDTIVVAGKSSDASGNYSIPAPPGIYTLLAFRQGYVADYNNAPSVTLAASQTITTNLNLIAANTIFSGKLADSTNSAVPAMLDGQLLAFSTNSLITIAVTDTNGNFTIPATSNNVWSIRPAIQSVLPSGYLPVEAGNEQRFQTFTGAASNSIVNLKRATAVLYGQVADNHGNPIPGIGLGANADGGQYDGAGFSDGNGNYFMAIDSGSGFIEVQNTANPPANNFLWTGTFFSVGNGQAANVNVTGTLSTARFRSHVTDDNGAPVTNLICFATSATGTSSGNTGSDGFLDMPVFAGVWTLLTGIDPARHLILPVIPPFTIVDGVNFTNDIIARIVTGQISGEVSNVLSAGIPNIFVTVTNHVGSTNYVLGATTDSGGNYFVGVFNGTWNVSLDYGNLFNAGYEPVAPVNVPVPPANATANFTALAIPPVPPPQILTTNLPGAVLGDDYFQSLDATNGAPTLVWSLASGTLPGGVALENIGAGFLIGIITNYGLFNFTLEVTDGHGQTGTQALSIDVLQTAPGPLQITTTTMPDGAVGCPYTNQVQATGGTPPYSWALDPSSVAFPAGLTLGAHGAISGTPTANGYFYLTIDISDSGSGFTTTNVLLSINTPLQVFPGPLTGGTVGSNYYGGLYASGGQQPQTWSIISGSLPPNLTLDPPSGVISGMAPAPGTYNFTARVGDGCATADLATSITIFTVPFITTTTLPAATPYVSYSAQLTASGGQPPYYFYTSDPLPTGLNLRYDGLIYGNSYYESTNSFLVQLSDSIGGGNTALLTIISTELPVLDLPSMFAPNQFSFRVSGVYNQSYTAQYTDDSITWTELYTTNVPDFQFFMIDTNATGNRLYRVLVNQ